jgi:hypothetical protein
MLIGALIALFFLFVGYLLGFTAGGLASKQAPVWPRTESTGDTGSPTPGADLRAHAKPGELPGPKMNLVDEGRRTMESHDRIDRWVDRHMNPGRRVN